MNIKKLAYIPAIVMMIIIFWFSNSDADTSSSHSDGVAYVIISAVDSVFDFWESEEEIRNVADSITHAIRKMAHFAEYMVLCILWIIGLYINDVRDHRLYIIAVIITALYACTDEIHQLFVSGRYGSIVDVIIDSAGAVFGGVVFAVCCRLFKRKKQ